MASFKLKSVLRGYKRLFGMTAEVYNEDGDLLDSVNLNNDRKRVAFKFDKDSALEGSKKADLSIKLIDNNGEDFNFSGKGGRQYDLDADEQTFTTSISANKKRKRLKLTPETQQLDNSAPVFTSGNSSSVDENVDPGTVVYDADASDDSAITYALNGRDSADFSIDPQTGQISINESPNFETKRSYSLNVLATDAEGNVSTQAVSLAVNDLEEGKNPDLKVGLDNLQASDLSSKNDVINAELGTLGNGFTDTVVDGSTTDNDTLRLKTNGTFSFDRSLDNFRITRIQNIENIHVTAENDVANAAGTDLEKVVNLKKLTVDGTFTTNPFRLIDWASTGATEFDYSGITSTLGTELLNADAGNQAFAGNIVFKGSAGADTFEGILGDVTMRGNAGNDTLKGSRQGVSYIQGGSGTDDIDLLAHNAQHTISLQRQTSQTSKDTVTNFQGFSNPAAFANNSFDLIEIDAATFSNYNAGKPQQQIIANVDANTNLSNTVVVAALEADLSQGTGANFNNNGDGILGFAEETGTLMYSASGNFSLDAQELLEIGGAEGANFVPAQQINVI